MVRDVFHRPGQIRLDTQGYVISIRFHFTLSLMLPSFCALPSLVSLDDLSSNSLQIQELVIIAELSFLTGLGGKYDG